MVRLVHGVWTVSGARSVHQATESRKTWLRSTRSWPDLSLCRRARTVTASSSSRAPPRCPSRKPASAPIPGSIGLLPGESLSSAMASTPRSAYVASTRRRLAASESCRDGLGRLYAASTDYASILAFAADDGAW